MEHFSQLTSDYFSSALEKALVVKLAAMARYFSSFINRVYKIQAVDDTAYIVKFYHPGHWTIEAYKDEHYSTLRP